MKWRSVCIFGDLNQDCRATTHAGGVGHLLIFVPDSRITAASMTAFLNRAESHLRRSPKH